MSATLSPVETSPCPGPKLPKPHPTINDLAIRVGTVNGSGSQSANLVLLRALYAMGIPCSGKNVFPSNIEGLPTWFHIRASAKGYVGHRLDPQILVCMNEPTAEDDVRQLKPGSICIYRDDFDVDLQRSATTSGSSPVPFQKLVEQAYPPDKTDKGYRDKLRKVVNMVYVGVRGLRLRDRDGGGRGGHPPRVPRPQGEGRRDQHRRRAGRLRLGRGEPAGRPALPRRADGRDRRTRS